MKDVVFSIVAQLLELFCVTSETIIEALLNSCRVLPSHIRNQVRAFFKAKTIVVFHFDAEVMESVHVREPFPVAFRA
jgi:hypothetical protein